LIQSENEKMIITNLEKMQEQSETQFKNQSDLTSTQIDITERLLRDQINSGAPQIIVKTATIKDKNFKIEEKYATFIDLEFRNSGNRNAYNVLARFYALTEDFKAVYEEIGYAGDKYFIGTNQENGYFITFKFNTQVTSFYFCYEITYIDKLTGKKDGYTVFNLLKNNHGQDMFEGCSNQLSNKLRNLINSVLINNHKNILYE